MPYDGSGLDLRGRIFAHQDLTGATFRGATLTGADFTGAKLDGAVFDGARLGYAVFLQADLTGASFAHATFDHTDLKQTRLTGTSFVGSDVTGALFSIPARFSGDPARPTVFAGATILLSTLGRFWSRLDLSGAAIVGLDVERDLSGLFAQHTILTTLDLSEKLLANADFDRARLLGTNCSGAQLADALFTGAVCTGAVFAGATLSGCDFTGADLTGANLDGAMLDRADLTGATLAGVSAKGAQFGGLAHAFDLPIAMAAALRHGAAPDVLAPLFQEHGRPLSASPVLQMRSGLWTIVEPAGRSLAVQFWTDANGAQTITVFAAQPFTLPPAALPHLDAGNVDALRPAFEQGGVTLSSAARIETGVAASWTLTDASGSYTIREGLDAGNGASLRVFTASVAAVLHGAYMPQSQLRDANLFGVSARNLQIYGDRANLDGAILESADLDGANLGQMSLRQARLLGVNLGRACLVNADLRGAILTASSSGVRAALGDASLQGADFTDATLFAADLGGAAVAVDIEGTNPLQSGVWLLALPLGLRAELDAASRLIDLTPSGGEAAVAALQDAFDARDVATVRAALQRAGGPSLSGAASIEPRSTRGTVWRILAGGAVAATVASGIDADSQWELYAQPAGGGRPFSLNPDGDPGRFLAIQAALSAGDAAVVAQAFASQGQPLPPRFQIAAAARTLTWEIADAPASYTAWAGYDLSLRQHVYVRPALGAMAAAFDSAGMPLRDQTTVTCTERDRLWQVDNDSWNPLNVSRGYVKFLCVREPDRVDVYGTVMHIERLGAGGRLEIVPETVRRTELTEANLSGDTLCPNGRKASTNRTNGTPWQEWMRASAPPAPPRCVPTGLYYCPAPSRG